MGFRVWYFVFRVFLELNVIVLLCLLSRLYNYYIQMLLNSYNLNMTDGSVKSGFSVTKNIIMTAYKEDIHGD
jgi:hypothetical protein